MSNATLLTRLEGKIHDGLAPKFLFSLTQEAAIQVYQNFLHLNDPKAEWYVVHLSRGFCTCPDQILNASVCKHMFACFAHCQDQPSNSSVGPKVWRFEDLPASLINAPHLIMDADIVESIGLKVMHQAQVIPSRPRPATADIPLQLTQSSRAALIRRIKEGCEKIYDGCHSLEDDELDEKVKAVEALASEVNRPGASSELLRLGIAPRKGSRAAARNNVLRGRESKRTGQMKAKPASFQQPKNFNLKVKKPKTKAITCGKDKREVLGMSRFTRGRA